MAAPNYKTPLTGTTIQTVLTVTGSVGQTLSVPLGANTTSGTSTTTAAVTRTAGDNSVPLVVNLTSSNIGEAAVPSSVTIPAGAASAIFAVTGVNDGALRSTSGVTIGVSASGYAHGPARINASNPKLSQPPAPAIPHPNPVPPPAAWHTD